MVYPYNGIFNNKKKFPSLKYSSASSNFKLTCTNLPYAIPPHTHKESGQRESEPIVESEFTFISAAQLCYLSFANAEL